jgi:selenium metabolism protein YedF
LKIIDTRGKECPKPIIETKKALKESTSGETFAVLNDSRTSVSNISRFLEDNGIHFTITEKDGAWTFLVTKESGEIQIKPEVDYCTVTSQDKMPGNFAVAVTSETMGHGDNILGKKLMRSFILSLTCLREIPSVMVFYNSGVRLAEKNSYVIDLLKELEMKGVEIILCGTCVEYYKLRNSIGAGKIGDMYLITEKLMSFEKIIRP